MTQKELLITFVDQSLASIGVLDHVAELIYDIYDDQGEPAARKQMNTFNAAIDFVNKNTDGDYDLITEERFQEYIQD